MLKLNEIEKIENQLSEIVINAAIEVHQRLGGPGLLESLYEDALIYELQIRKISVQSQVLIPVIYKDYTLREPLRLDLLVDGKIIIEVKATEKENIIYQTQLLTYLRLTRLKLGLVINFGKTRLIDGITRVANGL